jgi:hypothetical protein
MTEGDDGRRSSKGVVSGGVGFSSSGVGGAPAVGGEHEGSGVRVALVPCSRRRKGGEERDER